MLRVLFHRALPARTQRPAAPLPPRLIVLALLCLGSAGLAGAAAQTAEGPAEAAPPKVQGQAEAAAQTARGPAEAEAAIGHAPFDRYQRWRDEAPDDWRRANERVGAIGGWRSYARELEDGADALDAGHAGERGADQGGKHGH